MTSSATWTQLVSNARLQRSSQTLAVAEDKAWIFGGELVPREPVDNKIDVVELNKDAQTSTVAASKNTPSPRVGSASTVAQGHIWLFSGRGGVAMDAVDENGGLWRFTPSTKEWTFVESKSSDVPAARSYHTLTSDGESTLYLHAGCPTKGRLSDLWAFDIASSTWKELASAPEPARGGTSIAYHDGFLYRMGGFDGTREQGGSVDVYDVKGNTWESMPFTPDGTEGPEARSVAALLALKTPSGEDVVVTMFGERDPSSLGHAGAGKMLRDVWSYGIKSKTWTKVSFDEGEYPAPRGWFDADVVRRDTGDAVVVHGGLAEDNTRLGDVWLMEFK